MSIRTIVPGAVALTLLAGPVAAAPARPADPVHTGGYVTRAESARPGGGGGGSDLPAALALAGGGLIVAATAFSGGRLSARRALAH